jgi:predicted nucleic acid-binding protein
MQPLYMDALNWLDDFWDQSNGPRNPWDEFPLFRSRIRTFATVAGASGYTVVAVIDADTKTASAQSKWRDRRERELHAERRNIPLSLDGMYADALHQEGIQVIQPIGADADDVLAALAAAHNAPLLSKDRDFFRCGHPSLLSQPSQCRVPDNVGTSRLCNASTPAIR